MADRIFRNNVGIQLVSRFCVRCMWPWSDEGHVASQNIQQLRQFVDAEPSQPFSNSSDTRVISSGLLIGHHVCHLVMHRAKFVTREKPVIKTQTGLPEQYGPATVEPDQYRNEREKGR